MKTRNTAFTFVELIVSIGIILLVSIVGFTSYNSSLEKKDNVKVVSDIATIGNAFKSFQSETNILPEASGNKSFYKADGSYAHDASDSAYGVSSFVSEKTLAAKYLNSVPLDPRTGYYYAYAKTIDNKYYEIAGVEKQDNNYKSVVSGNYKTTGDELTNLVREYNGPEFVGNNSTTRFPYNPEEKVLTAQINDFSGTITITHNGNTIDQTNSKQLLDTALVTGDKVSVGIGSTASIYFSDGSKSYLGDTNSVSELSLSDMSYKEDSNLFTKVKLVLNIGTLWTSASKMSDNSSFDVESTNTVAAVRGTIFGVSVDTTQNTNVVVIRGAVEVDKITTNGTITPLINIPSVTDSSGTIIVNQNEAPKGLQVSSSGTPSSSTGAINEIPGNQQDKDSILIGGTDGNEDIVYLGVQELSNSGTSYDHFSAKVLVTDKVLKKFDYFKLNNTDTNSFSSLGISKESLFTLTGGTSFGSRNISTILNSTNPKGQFELLACKDTKKGPKCSKSKTFIVSEKMSYNEQEPTDISIQPENTSILTGYNLVGYAEYNDFNRAMRITASNTTLNASYDSLNSCLPYLSGSIFINNTCTDITTNEYLKHPLQNSNFAKDLTFSIAGNYGIFLDNAGNDDFLSYNISTLNLTSSTGFAIEMSVRGAALKRNDNNYYLFSLGNTFMYLNTSKLSTQIGTTAIGITPSGADRTSYEGNISDNKFYKVISVYSNGTLSMYIYDENNLTIAKRENIVVPSTSSLLIGDTLYIGSTKDKTYQWNDIIDYVKIYKR